MNGILLALAQISAITPVENADRSWTIKYTLSEAPAIVTFSEAQVSGDVNMLVESDGEHTLHWFPRNADDGSSGTRDFRLTAYSPENPPEWLVADLVTGATNWYESAQLLPGGIGADAYRSVKLLCRKIRGGSFVMGSLRESSIYHNDNPEGVGTENLHSVSFDHDWYMGVFEFTQGQWALLMNGARPANMKEESEWSCRPVEQVSYGDIRGADQRDSDAQYHYPNAPHPNSLLGKLRAKTGLSFDLPSDAEWEYSCRAGTKEGEWNDGTPIANDGYKDAALLKLARYGGYVDSNGSAQNWAPSSTTKAEKGGTLRVGSLKPNAWDLYDMHGNVFEWCVDWYSDDISGNSNGRGDYITAGTHRVCKGGAWNWPWFSARAAFRRGPENDNNRTAPGSRNGGIGFRVILRSSELSGS